MKKWCTVLFAAAMVLCMSVPAFAAETPKEERKEYRQEIADTKAELKETANQIAEVKAENATLSAQWKTMKTSRKNGDDLGFSKEEWKTLKGMAAEVKQIRAELKESTGMASGLRQEAKTAVKAKDLEKGLDQLDQAQNAKEVRLEKVKQIHDLLKQITEMEPAE